MHIRVFESEQEAAAACAARIAEAVTAHPSLVLGLPTGRTPLNVYRELVALQARRRLDWSMARTFNLEEWVGLSPEDGGSFHAYMERHLFRHVNLSKERIHFLDGAVSDCAEECERYEAELMAEGGLGLVLVGVGADGHLAFNAPSDHLRARCHRAKLSRGAREANAMFFGDDPSRVPLEVLTLGMGAIIQSRRAMLLAFGAQKAEAVKALVEGPLTPSCPASFLQLHRDVEVWLDAPAASALAGRVQ
ncbi:glucosamine-6-phosphate deaminase [Myxococcus fulvus]|uniref:Glucosamine-6-phosphate deaminase n=1 Tax=Myxococcus fulvus TaxID=33 RepID=A0A511SZG1_MYXFU|nr:glucosamine-6-phosphate deaminase [Myxococcus fulvus]GEN07281.1 glucosamine-6-phosphate deaminase [Myxococcus fulvus]SET96433.1 glucosamine-6-phosphate deaminase [Myxococcus fulvus]